MRVKRIKRGKMKNVSFVVLALFLVTSIQSTSLLAQATSSNNEKLVYGAVRQNENTRAGKHVIQFQKMNGEIVRGTITEFEKKLNKQYPDRCPCKIDMHKTKTGNTWANVMPAEMYYERHPDLEPKDRGDKDPETKKELKKLVQQMLDGDRRVVKLANLDKDLREKFKEIIDRPFGQISSLEILGKKGVPVVDHKKGKMFKGGKELAGGNWHHARTNSDEENERGFTPAGNESEGKSTADVIAFGGGDTLRVPMDEINWDQLDMDPDELK